MRVFGTQVVGQDYQARRAVYAVIPGRAGRVAAVTSPSGNLFLPGGGIEADETPEQALIREVEEECARRLSIVREIGEALQYFYAPSDDRHFAMHAVFYVGRFWSRTTGPAELPLSWVWPDDRTPFFHACHLWAVQSLRL